MSETANSANVTPGLSADATPAEKRAALVAAGVQVASRGKLSATAEAAYTDLVARQGDQQA